MDNSKAKPQKAAQNKANNLDRIAFIISLQGPVD
jgi:hypothetical protein